MEVTIFPALVEGGATDVVALHSDKVTRVPVCMEEAGDVSSCAGFQPLRQEKSREGG
jgi:hypothetical protein